MAASVLSIAEFAGMATQLGPTPVVPVPPLVEQVVAIGGTSTPSAPFGATTRIIRVQAKADCCIAWGASPTATVNNFPLANRQTEYLQVAAGQSLAVIEDP